MPSSSANPSQQFLISAEPRQYIQRHDLKGEVLVAIASGANMNFDRLRFVAERAEAGEEREGLLAVTIPEERGSFRHLCDTIGQRNVTEFSYRISDEKEAHVLVGIAISNREEVSKIGQSLAAQGFTSLDLVDDELSKDHLRYMVGGRSRLIGNERLFRFEFPERPGALMRFLSRMHPSWNISLFHYRNQGADYGRILVGIQVPEEEQSAISAFIGSLGYRCVDETDNPVYRLFLR
jgi:threonine dehydratase